MLEPVAFAIAFGLLSELPLTATAPASDAVSTIPASMRSTFAIAKAAGAPAGLPIQGFAVALTAGVTSIGITERLPLTIETRNVSPVEQVLDFPWMACSYDFAVTDLSTGKIRQYQKTGCDVAQHVADSVASGYVDVPDRDVRRRRDVPAYRRLHRGSRSYLRVPALRYARSGFDLVEPRRRSRG